MGRLRGLAVSTILLLGLSGCLQPTPLNVASIVADVGTYFVSGKTLIDHGISRVASQDCAITRLISEGAICRENVTYEPAPDILEPLPPDQGIPAETAASGPTQTSMQSAASLQGDYVKSSLPMAGPDTARGAQVADRGFLRSAAIEL